MVDPILRIQLVMVDGILAAPPIDLWRHWEHSVLGLTNHVCVPGIVHANKKVILRTHHVAAA